MTGKDFTHYLNNMIAELSRVENLLDNSKETIELLRDTNDSLLSSRTNEIMKKLTSVTLITFPMMFVLAIFSTSVDSFPFMNFPGLFLDYLVFSHNYQDWERFPCSKNKTYCKII